VVSELHPVVLVGIATILLIGKIGGEIFERIRQPAVLGELVAGILVGGLSVIGVTVFETYRVAKTAQHDFGSDIFCVNGNAG
jgi:Kef-type K+ transport system membrane component KefB